MYRTNRMSPKWMLVPVLAVVAIVVTLVGLSLYFHAYYAGPYYGPPYYGGWFLWPFFGFGWVFIPLLFFLVFFGFRWFFWGWWGWRGRYYDPAMEALRERFARGEITKEEFDRMSKDLEEH